MQKMRCEFDSPQDLANKVNKASLEDAKKRGINLDSRGGGPNGLNDALEGRFWAGQGPLGSYMCSEFSAYLHCILQELFDCSEEEIQTIQGNNHAIVRAKASVFRNPGGLPTDSSGYVRIEPQQFFNGRAGIQSGHGGVGHGIDVYTKPNPYRSGINNTQYDELMCKSGPGYTEGGGAANGLFGGGSSSAFVSGMLEALMSRMNQKNQGGAAPNTGQTTGPSTAVLPTVTATATATATPRATITPRPVSSLTKSNDVANMFPDLPKNGFF